MAELVPIAKEVIVTSNLPPWPLGGAILLRHCGSHLGCSSCGPSMILRILFFSSIPYLTQLEATHLYAP